MKIILSISGFLKEWHPETLSANQISENNIMIKLLCTRLFEFNREALVLDELRGCVAQKLSLGKGKTVEIQMDKKAEFVLFIYIIEETRKAEGKEFIFTTKNSLSLISLA